jgi:hypothetical protein
VRVGAIPTAAGVPRLLAEVFPDLGATDAGKALALWIADVGNALLVRRTHG